MFLKKRITYRGITAVMLLSVYLLNPFKVYTPYLSYQINYDYIANVLCENKSKPEMNCKGKCHLNKELKKTAKEESQSNKGAVVKLLQAEQITSPSEISFNPIVNTTGQDFLIFNEQVLSSLNKKFSPPPQL
jgi:hypothetical protein